MRRDTSSQRRELFHHGGRWAAALHVGRRSLHRRGVAALAEDRAGDAEAEGHEVAHDTEEEEGDDGDDGEVDARRKAAPALIWHEESFGRRAKRFICDPE